MFSLFTKDKKGVVKSNTRIIIGCPKHGDFEIMPQAHLSGHGCQKCGHETTCSYTRSNTKDFILIVCPL